MSDIRFHVTSCELHADGYHVCCLEVSDELARLRAENAELRADAERWLSLIKWDGQPFGATDTVWIEPGKEEQR